MLDDDFDGEQGTDEDSPVLKELRKKLKDAEAKAAKADELETRVAIHEAGLGTLSDKQRRAVLATHEGELTPDALKATATDLGFDLAAPTEEQPQVPAAEQEAHARTAEATGAAPAAEAQAKTLQDEINAASSEDEVKSILAREGMLAE